jgi:type VI secretion system protein ImpB
VQITYDVEIGDAMELKELPFVMGVLGDFSGKPDQPLPALKDRKLVEIDRDNFNTVLSKMAPRLAYRVDDKLSGKEGEQLNVELRFNNMDDFSPENVVKQVAPMKELLEMRDLLKNLQNRMDGNDKLDELLQQVLENSQARQALAKQLGIGEAAPAGGAEE